MHQKLVLLSCITVFSQQVRKDQNNADKKGGENAKELLIISARCLPESLIKVHTYIWVNFQESFDHMTIYLFIS